MRAAAAFAWLAGVGFGVPALAGLLYFVRTQRVWTFLGFPTYGHGPFERWGVPTSAALLAGFVLVCAVETALGGMLWVRGGAAPWLALGILPLELAYWIGFALPFGPVLGAIRTILVLAALAWR